MSIQQRCKKCRNLAPWKAKVCSCGAELPKGKRLCYFVKTVRGRRVKKSAGIMNTIQAEYAYASWLESLETKTGGGSKKLSEMFSDYLSKMVVEKRTYERDARRFCRRMVEFWDDIQCEELTVEMIREFQRHVRSASSPAYTDRHIAVGKAAWNYACDLPNPFNRVKLYRPDNTLVRCLTTDEAARLIDAAKACEGRVPGLAGIITVAMFTGLRLHTVLGLRYDQVDHEAGTITVVGKGARTHMVYAPPEVLGLLIRNGSDSPWVFPSPKTGRPYTEIRKSFAAAKKAAGIERPFRFHDLRHHFATLLGRVTRNARVIQQALGHADIKTTERYWHAWEEDIRDATSAVVALHPKMTPRSEDEGKQQD